MAEQTTNYQCPACTGPLHFSPDSGKLECEYCESVFEIANIEELYKAKEEAAAAAQHADDSNWDKSELHSDWGEDSDGMKTYSCPSCCAELICDASTAASSCPYCGNPTVVPGQFSGSLKPDYIIPFKLDKDAAVAALKQHYKGKFFLPKTFKDNNHIREIQGVYVPFWLFDGQAEGTAGYNATRIHKHRQGDYEITKTDHFYITRTGSIAFEKVPVDASTKMPDAHMDSIEPYDYSELKPFSSAYMPGFLADKYDVDEDDCCQRADIRCRETLENYLRSTVSGYTTVVDNGCSVRIDRGKVHYALLPVWMLNTKWNGKDFLFAMNGQTGKLVGDLPVDRGKFWKTLLGLTAILSVISSALILLMQ